MKAVSRLLIACMALFFAVSCSTGEEYSAEELASTYTAGTLEFMADSLETIQVSAEQSHPETPTITFTPTISLSPTILNTSTITLTPTMTLSPTITATFTPGIPDAEESPILRILEKAFVMHIKHKMDGIFQQSIIELQTMLQSVWIQTTSLTSPIMMLWVEV